MATAFWLIVGGFILIAIFFLLTRRLSERSPRLYGFIFTLLALGFLILFILYWLVISAITNQSPWPP